MFLGSAGGRFFVPARTHGERRAQGRSRMAEGHRCKAARRALNGCEHGATLTASPSGGVLLGRESSYRRADDTSPLLMGLKCAL
jgi:hypothetical protein